MMELTEVIAIVTAARSPRVMATNGGKVIDRSDANPCKEGNALARRRELEGRGFKSRYRKKYFFPHEFSI